MPAARWGRGHPHRKEGRARLSEDGPECGRRRRSQAVLGSPWLRQPLTALLSAAQHAGELCVLNGGPVSAGLLAPAFVDATFAPSSRTQFGGQDAHEPHTAHCEDAARGEGSVSAGEQGGRARGWDCGDTHGPAHGTGAGPMTGQALGRPDDSPRPSPAPAFPLTGADTEQEPPHAPRTAAGPTSA